MDDEPSHVPGKPQPLIVARPLDDNFRGGLSTPNPAILHTSYFIVIAVRMAGPMRPYLAYTRGVLEHVARGLLLSARLKAFAS
jgi:hypothetical protein